MQIITKEEYESAISPRREEPTPSPNVTDSANSTPDSEWKSSNKKKPVRVGQGLGKKLRAIKTSLASKADAKKTKQIKKKSRRKAT